MKEISYQIFLDADKLEKLRIKIHTDKGKILDIVVQYESFLNNKWILVVRYNCSPAFFHRDVLYSGQ